MLTSWKTLEVVFVSYCFVSGEFSKSCPSSLWPTVSGLMKMTACLHLAAFCASLLLFGPAVRAAVKESLFYNTGRDNYLFQNDVLFDRVVSWSRPGCAYLCSRNDRCGLLPTSPRGRALGTAVVTPLP